VDGRGWEGKGDGREMDGGKGLREAGCEKEVGGRAFMKNEKKNTRGS
jgi:hypothetical protein